MNKQEMLFIRACKSENPKKRLKTLHNRIYIYCSEKQTQSNLIHVLSKICMNYELTNMVKFIERMAKQLDTCEFYLEKAPDFKTMCLDALISVIMFSEVDKFHGFIPPAKFK